MSSLYVRNLARTWAAATAANTLIPFYDTVAVEQDPVDPIWWTIEFSSDGADVTFCSDRQETGELTIVVFGDPGQGDVAVLTAMEQIIADFMLSVDPALPVPQLMLGNHMSPQVADGGRWVSVEVAVDYFYAYTI